MDNRLESDAHSGRAFLGPGVMARLRIGEARGVMMCRISGKLRLGQAIIGLALGPWVSFVLFKTHDELPLFWKIFTVCFSVIGWVALLGAITDATVIFDLPRGRIVMRRLTRWAPWRQRIIALGDVRRIVTGSVVRYRDMDDAGPGEPVECHTLGVELANGRIVQLVETSRPDDVTRIRAFVARSGRPDWVV